MERNIVKDEETLKFLNDLQQLDKDEIIECLMGYFTQLKLEANGDINAPETEYMRNEFGRIKMTQVNRLKIFVKHSLNGKV